MEKEKSSESVSEIPISWFFLMVILAIILSLSLSILIGISSNYINTQEDISIDSGKILVNVKGDEYFSNNNMKIIVNIRNISEDKKEE